MSAATAITPLSWKREFPPILPGYGVGSGTEFMQKKTRFT
jgi:hypothetical protein